MVSYFQRGVNQIMNKNEHMTLGLDLGIASVGWCLFRSDENENPERIIDLGSFVYDQLEDGKTGERENEKRRVMRGMRRQRRRKARRLSDCRELFKKYLDIDFEINDNRLLINGKPANDIYKSATDEKCKTPFGLKLKGLNEKLTPEEFALALYHYMKYRGFKSNRKSAEEKDKKQKVLLSAIKSMSEAKEKMPIDKRYITYVIWDKFENGKRENKSISIHNRPKEYNLTIDRSEYENEIKRLFDKQIEFGTATNDFKEDYLKLFRRQRSYSNGPADPSPYKVDFTKARGICSFDGNPYAIKDSYSATAFLLLSKLANFRYKSIQDFNFKKLEPKQIEDAFSKLITKTTINYLDVLKACKIENCNQIIIKGLSLTKKEKRELIAEFEKHELDSNDWNEYSKKEQEKLLSKPFFKKSDFFNKLYGILKKKKVDISKNPAMQLKINYVAFVSFKYKTDEQIRAALENPSIENADVADLVFSKSEIDKILSIPTNASKTINISQEICDKLIPIMMNGVQYDEAMTRIGIKHYDPFTTKTNQSATLPEIDTALADIGVKLNNPVVKHTLVQMRKIINAIIKIYGAPTSYSIEMARELKKNFKDRQAIENEQKENQNENIKIKLEMMDKFHNQIRSFNDAGKKDNFLRYKLFKEQKGISPYTGKEIKENLIFNNNYYQVDHILPISRSFNDSISNKVLVETKENQEKKNRTPWEYYGEKDFSKIEDFAASCPDRRKVANLLFKGKIEDSSGFINADTSDTSYIAKLAADLIKFFLVEDNKNCKTISGAVTAKLRNLWNVSGRVHSYISTYDQVLYKMRDIKNYLYDSLQLDDNSLVFNFKYIIEQSSIKKFEPLGECIKIEIKKRSPKNPTYDDNKFNSCFESVINNFDYYSKEKLLQCKGKDITALQEITNHLTIDSTNYDPYDEAMSYILGDVYKQIVDLCNKKNRDNDLHHALDAAVIGCVTPAAVKKISDFYQYEECEIDYRTGEEKLAVQLPYPDFNKEVLLRVYERDENKLIEELNKLPMYKDDPATHENVHVMWPTRQQKTNYKGAISGERFYGTTMINGIPYLTKTIAVDKLTEKNVDDILNPDNGNTAVIKACKDWLNIKENRPTYPTLPKKEVAIKKVTIKYTELSNQPSSKDKGNKLRYADNSDCIRVDIYKSKVQGDETLYFVPVYYYQLFNERNTKQASIVKYKWFKGSGAEDCGLISAYELKQNYKRILSLNRYSLIELNVEKSGKICTCYAYSGGLTSGKFEVYSLLGDNYDLFNNGILNDASSERCRLTVSTIKSIKLHNISVLGKIS